jgi:D-arginine dehydrogenase
VLDRAAQPGSEASAQNAGMVRRMGEDPYERALAVRTVARLDTLGWPVSPARRTGALLGLGRDPHHLHDAVAHLRAVGVDVQQCDRPGDLSPALRDSPVKRAWYLPDERVADAWALVSGFVEGLRRHGGALRCDTLVTRLLVDGDRVVGVMTDGGPIFADSVVLAAGAWSAMLARTVGLERPLMPLRRALLQSAPHPLSDPAHPWCWVDDVGVYARPEGGGWLVSACDEAVDWPGAEPSQGGLDPWHRALAAEKLGHWMPWLADARLVTGWTGLRTFAPDRRPVLGPETARPGLWWAAGLGGFGVTCSLAVGEAVASWMTGAAVSWLPQRGVAPDRPFFRRWAVRPQGDLHHTELVDACTAPAAV